MATKTRRTSGKSSSRKPDDYVSVAIAYAEGAIEDKQRRHHGKKIQAAARRFLRDLKRAQQKRPPFLWSPEQANVACEFIEGLPHVEGEWDTPTIKLHPAQVFFVVQLFGFRSHDGSRRFSLALFACARKNAKSTLDAAIMVYCLCMEHTIGPQVISAATTGAQARIVFTIAKKMVEKLPDLREAFTLEAFANAIARYEVGGSFKPINSKASTQDGLNPSHVSLDEIHAHKDADLLNVIRTAAGARKNALFLYTTTEGYENQGPWQELRTFAKQVLEEIIEADHCLVVFFDIDDEDEEFDESKWIKANPLADVNPYLLAAIRKEAIEAKSMPGQMAEFRIKRLNRPSAAAKAWVNLMKWNKCGGPIDLDMLEAYPCWGALDLASTTDMAAWRLVWKVNDIWYTWGRYWVPEEAVRQRTERKTVPYKGWVEGGWITQTSGDTIDYDVIERDMSEDVSRFRPIEIAFDAWNARQLVNSFVAKGWPMIEFVQGTKSYNDPMNELERIYMKQQLRHGGNPVLRWNAANVVPFLDGNLNKRPDRKRSADKIDGMCALFMALGRALVAEDQGDMDGFMTSPVIAG